MPGRSDKSLLSDYVTPFDVDVARSLLNGMSFAVSEGYGVLSIITFRHEDNFEFIHDSKSYLFSCHGGKIFGFDSENIPGFVSQTSISKVLAKKLKSFGSEEDVILVLNVFNEDIDDSSDGDMEYSTINRTPDKTYFWSLGEFMLRMADSPFPAQAFCLPPRIAIVGGEIMEEPDNDYTPEFYERLVFPVEGNVKAQDFLSLILEYTHEGSHVLSLFWDEPVAVGHERFDIRFTKKKSTIELSYQNVSLGVIEHNLMVENMDYRMDTGGKFTVTLMSTNIDEATGAKEIETRGWRVAGNDITSLDDKEIKDFMETVYDPKVINEEHRVYCDSWDYPVTKSDLQKVIYKSK